MSHWRKLRALAAKPVEVIFFMVAGGMLSTFYIEWANLTPDSGLRDFERYLNLAFWLMLIVHNFVRAGEQGETSDAKEPSPRLSGVSVALLTGLAAAIYVGLPSGGGSLGLAALIVCVTLLVVAFIWRFATRNAGQIGEAKFSTPPMDNPITKGS